MSAVNLVLSMTWIDFVTTATSANLILSVSLVSEQIINIKSLV